MTSTTSETTREWVGPAIAALITLAVGVAVMNTLPVGVMYDDGMYVILAKSLATGHGLRWLNLPGAPPATHFPPGYPAFLALLWMLYPHFPGNVLLFKFANACFLAMSAAGTVVFARRRLGLQPWSAVVTATAAAIGIPTLVLSATVMSEPLFLALLFPVLLYAERVADGGERPSSVIALGLAIGLLALIRTHGIAIAGGAGCVLLVRHRVRDAALLIVSTLIVLLPWQLWVHAHVGVVPPVMGGNYQPYTTWFADGFRAMGPALIIRTLGMTTRDVIDMFSMFAAPSLPHAAKLVALTTLGLLAGLGAYRFWRVAPVTVVFAGLYLVIVLVWPFYPSRFVWGIWPVLILLFVAGGMQLRVWRPRVTIPSVHAVARTTRVVALACAWLIAVEYSRYTLHGYVDRWWSLEARMTAEVARPLVQWARHAGPNMVLASNDEPLIYLYGNHLTVPVLRFTVRDFLQPPSPAARAAALRGIASVYHVDAVVLVPAGDSTYAGATQLAQGPAPWLFLRDSIPNNYIFSPTPSR